MAKSKKKRPREVMKAAAVPSPNGVESNVLAAGSSPPSTSSTPIKHGSTTSTPIQNGTMKYNNDDPSTWSKSKKNRMRKKGKKDAAKKLLMVVEGASANRPSEQATPGSANDGKRNAISPSKKSMSSGATDDSNSHKRLRKNPVESPSATVKNGKSEKIKQAVADGSSPPNKKKKSNTPTVMQDDDNTQKSPSKSDQKKAVESPRKSSEVDQVAADGSTPKKTKKKKKKKANTPTASTEQAPKSPANSNQNNKDPIKNSAKKSPSKSNQNSISDSTNNDESNSNKNIAKPSPQKLKISLPKPSQMSTLQKAFLERLTSSRFRELNEELYTHESGHSFEYFTKNPELFDQYHVGFRKQAEEWPVNPIDVIYKKILKDYANGKKKEKGEKTSEDGQGRKQVVVADFGCGDAKLAERLLALQTGNDGKTLTQAVTKKKKAGSKDQVASCPFKVFSFDLVSGGNPLVTPADMSNVPLPNESVDLGVYSLALMGTNVADFVREAWRVLKFNGVLRVAEVRSRFETAAAADENEKKGGGGKRAKLNNKLKHPKKTNHKKDSSQDGEKAPQPIMLLDEFIALMERCGFQCTNMDRSNKMFLFMDFTKVDGSKGLSKKESFTAKPCIYKRR